jgi:hypothetical protein
MSLTVHSSTQACLAAQALPLRGRRSELADEGRALSALVHALRAAFVAAGVVKGGV